MTETTKTHIALIDEHTGFFWGCTEADTPIEAAQAVDRTIDCGRADEWDYETCHRSDSGATYHAHDLTGDAELLADVERADGQDAEIIARIAAAPYLDSVKRFERATA